MKKVILVSCVLLIIGACNRDTELIVPPPLTIPAGYPATLKFSEERYNAYVAAWVRLAQQYNVSAFPPQFDSVLMTPPSLPTIDFLPNSTDTMTLEEARTQLYQFIDNAPDFLNVSTNEIDVQYELTFPRVYFFSISKKFPDNYFGQGFINAHISHNGIMTGFSDQCPPTLNIPTIVNIDSVQAKEILKGKKLFFEDWGGKDSLILSEKNMICAEITAVLIDRWSDPPSRRHLATEYRRVWRITSPVFYLYVDAITGEDLNYVEQYVIF